MHGDESRHSDFIHFDAHVLESLSEDDGNAPMTCSLAQLAGVHIRLDGLRTHLSKSDPFIGLLLDIFLVVGI